MFGKGKRLAAVILAGGLLFSGLEPAGGTVFADGGTAASSAEKQLKLWYDEPASSWEKEALPLGNSYMGAMVFGKTDTERIQISENSLSNPYRSGKAGSGLNNFAEVYLDFNHPGASNYRRELDLKTAVQTVAYTSGGVDYTREYFTSYPAKVLAVRLTADQPGKISFGLRPQIPFLKAYGTDDNRGKTGTVTTAGDTITLSGEMERYGIEYEGQIKVIPEGGTYRTGQDSISVSGADSVTLLMAVGTNYRMESSVFEETTENQKLAGFPHPHEKVTEILNAAAAGFSAGNESRAYEALRQAHITDYQTYFNRVSIDLGGADPGGTTDAQLNAYRSTANPYLEELYFHYGRYLLIACSRPGGYPANLQGTWNDSDGAQWSGGYWHNINVQMNYWPAFSTNLADLFQPYADYQKAYMKHAMDNADTHMNRFFPEKNEPGKNGWCIGTGGWLYTTDGVVALKDHSGPTLNALTAKLFYDWYDYTRDDTALEQAYPVLSEASRFLSKVVEENEDGEYLVKYSASPEQNVNGANYYTTGSGFDQQLAFDNHRGTLELMERMEAIAPEKVDSGLKATLEAQTPRMAPALVGDSGQIKEYREETVYGSIGEKEHRHISHLMGLYPGQVINSQTPAWLDAAKYTLSQRGSGTSGWSKAHRQLLWARAKEGNEAYRMYQILLRTSTLSNLWDSHPPFQIDGNFGGTAGVAEMLLQSHEGYIEPLAALPDAWKTGSFSGLAARGNFEVAAQWSNGRAERLAFQSNRGGVCKVKYPGLSGAVLRDGKGNAVVFTEADGICSFETAAGETYTFTGIPAYTKTAPPANLQVTAKGQTAVLSWTASADAEHYRVYRALGDAPAYELLKDGVKETACSIALDAETAVQKATYKVTAIRSGGTESPGVTRHVTEAALAVPQGVCLDRFGEANQISWQPVEGAEAYRIYRDGGFLTETEQLAWVDELGDKNAGYQVAAVSGKRVGKPADAIAPDGAVNVALGKTVTANRAAFSDKYAFDKMVDGDYTTRMAALDVAEPLELVIDLEESCVLDSMTIREYKYKTEPRTRARDVSLYTSVGGGDWREVFSGRMLDDAKTDDKVGVPTTFELGGVQADKVRLVVKNDPGQKPTATFHELELMAARTTPAVDKTGLLRQLETLRRSDLSALSPEEQAGLQRLADSARPLLAAGGAAEEIGLVSAELADGLAALPVRIENVAVLQELTAEAPKDGKITFRAAMLNYNGQRQELPLYCAWYRNGILQAVTHLPFYAAAASPLYLEHTLSVDDGETAKVFLWDIERLCPLGSALTLQTGL